MPWGFFLAVDLSFGGLEASTPSKFNSNSTAYSFNESKYISSKSVIPLIVSGDNES